ncbi:MAG: hypothetical protein Q9217_000477 [Psora testacea]
MLLDKKRTDLTLTCATYRRKNSKGPFRPHTVLSARALAAHLASEDHPSKKICPYIRAQRAATWDGEFESKPVPGRKYERSISPFSPTIDLNPLQLKTILSGSGVELREKSTFSSTETQASGRPTHQESLGENRKNGKRTTFQKPNASQKPKAQTSKGKDPKSMTQNLFDTASMTLLQLTKLPQLWLSSASCDEQREGTESRHSMKHDAAEDGRHTSDIRVLGVRDHLKPTLMASDQPKTQSPRVEDEHAIDGLSPVGSEPYFSDPKDEKASSYEPTQAEYNILRPHCEICDSKRGWRHPSLFYIPKGIINEQFYLLNPGTRIQLTRPPVPSDFLTSVKTAAAKHRSICMKVESGVAGPKQEMLRQLGRTDSHIPLLHCSREHQSFHAQVYPRFAQSVSHSLDSRDALLQWYVSHKSRGDNSTVVWSDSLSHMIEGFHVLHVFDFHPSNVFSCLWQTASSLYVGRPRSFKGTGAEEHISNRVPATSHLNYGDTLSHIEAAHIAKLIFAALTAFVRGKNPIAILAVQRLRKSGHIALPEMPEASSDIRRTIADTLTIMDAFDDDMAHLLLKKVTGTLATRIYLPDSQIFRAQQGEREDSGPAQDIVTLIVRGLTISEAVAVVQKDPNGKPTLGNGSWLGLAGGKTAAHQQVDENTKIHLELLVEWLRGILLKEWDGNEEVPKCSAVGGALELLDGLLTYFRAINHATMTKASEEAMGNCNLMMRMTFFNSNSGGRGRLMLEDRLSRLTDYYLVLNIRREEVLTDAMNQLWRRQKRELLRPLKVRLGQDKGEEGVDHGGVQQEFFRIAIAEALDPKYGAFTTDPVTRMSWFQVGSLEPSYKFELLGVLVSLAVYNGLTLPFTFPLALYMKLLHHEPDHVDDIADGWPELTKGLRALRDWEDGDVEHVFMRDYVFSVDVFGETLNVDMSEQSRRRRVVRQHVQEDLEGHGDPPPSSHQAQGFTSSNVTSKLARQGKHQDASETGQQRQSTSPGDSEAKPTPTSSKTSPRQPSPGPPTVTNATRDQYIRDYIHHLTAVSINDQFRAFACGFTTCISPKSLTFFTPRTLKELVEGFPHVDTHGLESVTKYEGGYYAKHHVIKDFWNIVHSWAEKDGEAGQEKVRRLLEFVTASDRLPVGGMTRVLFVIQKNGVGDERLPTSLTCFGRLLLPEFSSRKVLAEMLGKAVENSKGFGQP